MRIVKASFAIADAAGLVADAKKERVTIKPDDIVFVVEGMRAVACVRMIGRGRNRGLCVEHGDAARRSGRR